MFDWKLDALADNQQDHTEWILTIINSRWNNFNIEGND